MPKVEPAASRLYGPLARGFGLRVKEALGHFSSRAEAARAMELSTDQMNKIVAETAVPNFAAVAALAKRCGLSLDWFAFDGPPGESSTGKGFIGSDETVALKRLDGGCALRFPVAWLQRSFNRTPEQLAMLDAAGTAMEPTIRRTALLIVDTSDKVSDGEIFVFDFGGELVVRRTQREPDGTLVLHADNSSYEAIRLSAPRQGAETVGRVVWIGNPV